MPENGKDNPSKGEQRKLAAVMFTDIVGYSRMMHRDEAAALDFLDTHNTLVKEQVAAHGGRVIKAIGDSLMMDFKSVVDAVNCSVAIQTRFHKLNRSLGKDQQRYLRVGIHLGDVVVTAGDIFGDGVNIASRLVPLSPHGGICVSREVETHLRGMRSIKVRHWGVRFLKNIPRPVEVFQVWAAGMDPAAGHRFQFLRGKGAAAVLAATVLLVLAVLLLPRWMERGGRGWDPWLVEDFGDWQAFSERWQAPEESAGWLVLKKPVPSRAFRVKAVYRVPEGGRADVTLAALVMGTDGNSLFSRRKADPRLKWVTEQVGLRRGEGLEDEALREGPKRTASGLHWQTLTYDSGRLSAWHGTDSWIDRVFGGAPLATWVRKAPAGTLFRFALKPGEARLERLEIHFKDTTGEKDTADRAEAYALAGRTDTALKLYDDLFDLAQEPEEKCEALYRKALVYRSAGQRTEAMDLYYKILKGFPENRASGYARMDLGLIESTQAYEAEGDAETRRHAEQAHGYFAGLLKRDKGHPEAERAAFLLAKNDLEYLGGGKDAKQAALSIVRDGGAYAQRALGLILDEESDAGKGWVSLEPLAKKGKLKGPLFERAAGAQAEAYRLGGRTTDLSALVEKACRSGKYGTKARAAVVKQWAAAEEAGLSEAKSKALADKLEERPKAARAFYRAYLRCGGTRMETRAAEYLRMVTQVVMEEGGDKAPTRREFLDWVQGEAKARGGASNVLPREEGGLRMAFDASKATQELVMEPGVGPFSLAEDGEDARKAVDVRLYRRVAFKAKFPKKKEFRLCLAEAGVSDPDALYRKGRGDGEQYELASFTGNGEWKRYQADLAKADPDLDRGNQEGDLKLDLSALGAVVLVIPEGEGKGALELKDLVFER